MNKVDVMGDIEDSFNALENILRDRPKSREISIALTKLEECYMWTMQSINGKHEKSI